MTTETTEISTILDCDAAWENFCQDDYTSEIAPINKPSENLLQKKNFPKCSDIYISTKTKISYLNSPINLEEVFWRIKVNSYFLPEDGVIKKQMKFNFKSQEELDDFHKRLKDCKYFDEHIITSIRNPEGKIKFKDVRKISIGINKKDILSYRCKRKSAFYNCFVLILRIKDEDVYKESHIKVFNTGKLELPGIQSESFLKKILKKLVDILNIDCGLDVNYIEGKSETVLINSNFNCGYYINREKFTDILKFKYHFQTSYDPCSYPGIMSKFYYDPNLSQQTGIKPQTSAYHKGIKEVSFMVFRTGSVLIVGKCNEFTLREIYLFIKNILHDEYLNICQSNQGLVNHSESKKPKKKKVRRKDIIVIQGVTAN
jgi:TATA-box binding protein (TBP) (component of TFIID and TFIIIB)